MLSGRRASSIPRRRARRAVKGLQDPLRTLPRMDILLISDVYFPRVNGVSTSIRTLATELARLGHAVTLVAPDYGTQDPALDFEILRLPARPIFFDPEDRWIRNAALRECLTPLARRHWDVIHVHTPFQAHRLGVRLAKCTGAPTVETYHTYFEPYVAHYLPLLPGVLLRALARRLSRRLCHEVDHLIVPTRQMTRVLRGYGIATPDSVVPSGIDLAEFGGGDGARFRARHGIAPHRPTLVTVSRLAREKNIEFLLDVAWALVEEFPDLLFIVAGEGPDAPRLHRRASSLGLDPNVLFVGNLDRRTELLDCYKAGDVFVFASPTETQGLVLTEAMALGVPIVSTAVMGTATVLEHARSARVAEEHVAAFADQVATLLRDPVLRQALSDAGPQDAYAWHAPALVGKVAEVYRHLATARIDPDAQAPIAAA